MQRVRDGAIGEIVAIQETYIGTPYVLRERQPDWSEMEYQLQNWYHFNWLSGDQTAQQLVHSLDKASWALGDVPPREGLGPGRAAGLRGAASTATSSTIMPWSSSMPTACAFSASAATCPAATTKHRT